MIQRIQTVYLVLAFIAAVLVLFFPLFAIDIGTDTIEYHAEFGAYGLTAQGDLGENLQSASIPLYLVVIVLALLTACCIFLYKNRKRQLLVCRLNLIIHLLVFAGICAFYYMGRSYLADNIVMPEGETATVKLGTRAGFYFLAAAIPLLLMAIRGIRYDEKLVKSLDRLR